MIDDGHGIPESHRDLILEPGVTTRHLDPSPNQTTPVRPRRWPLPLPDQEARSIETEVLSTSSPTAIQATFDTNTLPERTLQSTSRPSNSNLRATLQRFTAKCNANQSPSYDSYYGPPARILATLLHNRIIQTQRDECRDYGRRLSGLGLAYR